MNEQISHLISPNFGCDPEIFLTKGDKIIGAERVIPEEGLGAGTKKPIVLDGVQVELNPRPNSCRTLVGNELAAAFKTLKNHLAKMEGITASFKQVVEVDPKELEGLSQKAKALGCAPSENIYDSKATVGIDGSVCGQRSAGGHIHLGIHGTLFKERQRLVVLMDILLGNTAVLMDRNPLNAQRRKNYGRAGEHRLPQHGLEYRTLSNFWLRAWPLTSGVFGISRFACNVLANSLPGYTGFGQAEEKLLQISDVEAVIRAINTNDVELAKKNYSVVRDYLAAHTQKLNSGLHAGNVEQFDYFVSKIDTDGIEYWFPEDPLKHWTETYYATTDHSAIQKGVQNGWEHFLSKVVATEMKTGLHKQVAA